MADEAPAQYWLRNDKGKVWGPMQASTIQLLLTQNAFPGKLQASADGLTFGMIGRFPELREGVPVDLWGVDPSEVGASPPPGAGKPETEPAAPPLPAERKAAAPAPGVPPGASAGRAPAPGVPPGAAARPPRPPPAAPAPAPAALAPEAEAMDPAALAPEAMDPSALAPGGEAAAPAAPAPGDDATGQAAAKAGSAEEAAAQGQRPGRFEWQEDDQDTDSLPASGELEKTSPLRLAYIVLAAKESCRIRLECRHPFDLYFQKGLPVHAGSEDPDLDVGAWLEARGAITKDVLAKAEEAKPSFGGSITTALMASGLVDTGAVFPLLTELARESWLRALIQGEGSFQVSPGEAPPADGIPVGAPPGTLFNEAARRLKGPELRLRLADSVRAPVMRSNASVLEPGDLGLGPQEARLASLINGVRTPLGLGEEAGVDPDTALRLAWLLAECRMVSFAEPAPVEAPAKAEEAKAEAPPEGAKESSGDRAEVREEARGTQPPSAPAEPEVDWDREGEKLAALVEKWSKRSHLDVLGLPSQCSDDAVKEAFNELARQYHPDRVAMAPAEIQTLHTDLFERIREAYAAIATTSKRRQYLNELAAKESEAAAIASNETLLEQVRKLVKARDYEKASSMLDEVLATNPGLAAGWAWRALLKIQRAKDPAKVRSEAESMIERALQLGAGSREVQLLAARIAKHYGEEEARARHQRKADALSAKRGKG